ncbi:MAG: antitoxin Xre-like helix-turn-helix domain-containing protein [Leptospirales bacterium]
MNIRKSKTDTRNKIARKKLKSSGRISNHENFGSKSSLSGISNILGGMKVLHRKIESRLDLIEIGRKGLSKNAFEHLANYLNYSAKQMADILPITERTIQRYNKNKHFSPDVSDHILQIAEVSAKGAEVFHDKSKFISWMNYPCVSFANKTPLSLLQSKFGVDMILDELGRIEHGVFS